MEKTAGKIHPVFDFPAAEVTYAPWDSKVRGEFVTSPFHLYSVEKARDLHNLRQGAAFPTDVFVFGKGPGPGT